MDEKTAPQSAPLQSELLEQHLIAARDRAEFHVRVTLELLRTLVIANGGGLLGVITFLGYKAQQPHQAVLPIAVWIAFVLFALGMAAVILTFILFQQSQHQHHSADWAKAWHAYSAFTGSPEQATQRLQANERHGGRADLYASQTNWVAFASFFFFVAGALSAALAVVHISTP